MKKIFEIIKKIFFPFILFILHIFFTNMLPPPFNHINIIYLGIFYRIFIASNKPDMWFMATLLFLLELFSATTFGTHVLAYFCTVVLMNILFINFFTSRSLPFLSLYFAAGLTIYRIIFYLTEYFASYLNFGEVNFSLLGIVSNILPEIILTTLVMMAFHFIYALFNKKMNPRYLTTE